MKFLKATTTKNEVEYFNLDRVLTIKPNGKTTKILFGANMYWNVYTDTMKIVDISEVIK